MYLKGVLFMAKRTNTARWTGKYWRIDVQQDGRRKSFYSSIPGRTGQREANAKADKWLDTGIGPCGQRISAVYPLWFASMQETTSAGNCRNIASRWKIWILPVIGNKRITSMTEQDAQEVINKAFAAGKSKKTLKSICADIRAFFKYCRLCKLSTFNPEALHIPAGARYKGKKVLQPDDLATLFSTDTTQYRGQTVPDEYINAYRFQVLTGLRPGELLGLQWSDIHGSTVHIRRAINVDGETTKGKNQNAVRSFVLSDMARRVLDEQRAITGHIESVFAIPSERHYYKRWKIYCAANELTPCSLYELRHTFVSVVKTLPAGEVKGLVGHSLDMDTFGVYAHALTGDAENTAAAVNGVFLRVLKNA